MKRLFIPPAFSRAMLSAHSALGVFFGAAVLMLCVSGTLAVMTHEFALWETPIGPIVESASPELLAKVAERAYPLAKAKGAAHDMYVNAPSPETPRLTVYAYGEKGQEASWMADAQGNLGPQVETPWSDFMRDQHYDFNIPKPFGDYLVGIIGTLLLASLISGLIAHRRILKDAFRLRLGGSPRLSNADVHNRIGVWALPFHFIVALTGSLLGLAGLIIGVLAFVAFNGDQEKAIGTLLGPQAIEDPRPAPLPNILPMVAEVQRRAPGTEINALRFEHIGTRGQLIALGSSEAGHLTRLEGWSFDGSGRFLAKLGYTDGSVGIRIYGMITPLHFGDYGGIVLKLIYFVLGTGLCTVVATGGNIWLTRRREQGRPHPQLERAWAAVLWFQLPAYALTGLAVLLGLNWIVPFFWVVFAMSIIAAIRTRREVRNVARFGQLSSVAAIAGLLAIHSVTRAWQGPLIVDAILVAGMAIHLRLGLCERSFRKAPTPPV
jgi:uncharacterized iron-regulated membrane protein